MRNSDRGVTSCNPRCKIALNKVRVPNLRRRRGSSLRGKRYNTLKSAKKEHQAKTDSRH